MGIYSDRILPRLVDWTMNIEMLRELRDRCLQGVRGDVLEVGFGSGLNLPHYPKEVTKVYAVDPATLGRKLAKKRLDTCDFPVEFVGLDAESIPLADAAVDAAVVTWTLCTIPDPLAALLEMRRTLRPGGKLHFVEHGRAPEQGVKRWQERLNRVHGWYAGGCNLNRAIDEVVQAGGFEIESLDAFYVRGPKVLTFHYLGIAAPR